MQNKVILITGSTSGIGLGIAEKFAKMKAKDIIINGFGELDEIEKITARLKQLGAGEVTHISCDMTDPPEIEQLFAECRGRHGGIDVLVNNAGIQHVCPIEDFPDDKWEKIIRLDLIAVYYTCKYAIATMKEHGWGRIINIGSAHSLVASPYKSAYVAAKHGINGLTKAVALEVAKQNITVNCVCPGYVKTPLVMDQVTDTAKARKMKENSVIEDVILAAQATKKFIEIEEVAEFVYFLCSDAAKSITGSCLSIDGGWTAQ